MFSDISNSYCVCHVRYFRNKLGFTQTELAKMCGTTQTTISSLESGKYGASVHLAILLSRALGVSVHDLFSVNYYGD